jgi:thioredoxin reductase (NADPH)
MTSTKYNVAIIGSGCAGLTAAIYCARALLNPIVFAGYSEEKGGLLTKTSIVENYPGFPDGIDGYELVNGMERQAIKYGTKIIEEQVTNIQYTNSRFEIKCDSGVYYSVTIIVCTGSTPNRLNLPNENKFWSKGISSCAVCDGVLYRNKAIVVVGGGDSAMEEALFLTKFSNVTLIHRRDKFRASKVLIARVKANPKINIIYDTVIEKINGVHKLESIDIKNIKTGDKNVINVDGLFYGLGLVPNSQIVKNLVNCDADGYIIRYRDAQNNYKTLTSHPAIFVAGDVTDKKYKQAIVACADGCKAAMDVEKYLETLEFIPD